MGLVKYNQEWKNFKWNYTVSWLQSRKFRTYLFTAFMLVMFCICCQAYILLEKTKITKSKDLFYFLQIVKFNCIVLINLIENLFK